MQRQKSMFNAKMNFEVDDLIKILTKNRAKHVEAYGDAKGEYQKKLIRLLEKKLKSAKDGNKIGHYIELSVPEHHTSDYDNMIAMLKSTSNKTVELDSVTYLQISKDQWTWSSSFTSNTLSYSNKR